MEKTKEKILKMTKKELEDYKWSDNLNIKRENTNCLYCSCCSGCSNCSGCSYCSYCSDCSDCSGCSNCSNCFYCSNCAGCFNCSDCFLCRNATNLRYAICNVEVGKKDYEKKMKELLTKT